MVAITFKTSIALVIALAQVMNPVMAEKFRIEAPTQAQIDFWGGWGARGAVSVREWDSTMGDKNKFSFQQKDGSVAKVSTHTLLPSLFAKYRSVRQTIGRRLTVQCEIERQGKKRDDITMTVKAVGKHYWLGQCGCHDNWRLICNDGKDWLMCDKGGVRPDKC